RVAFALLNNIKKIWRVEPTCMQGSTSPNPEKSETGRASAGVRSQNPPYCETRPLRFRSGSSICFSRVPQKKSLRHFMLSLLNRNFIEQYTPETFYSSMQMVAYTLNFNLHDVSNLSVRQSMIIS